jgi:hypothetical protein
MATCWPFPRHGAGQGHLAAPRGRVPAGRGGSASPVRWPGSDSEGNDKTGGSERLTAARTRGIIKYERNGRLAAGCGKIPVATRMQLIC